MNKEAIIKILNKYNFDKNEYVVLSTGAMVLMGIKTEAHDIDIAVSPKLWNEIIHQFNGSFTEFEIKGKKVNIYSFDNFDCGFNYFDRDRCVFVEGIPIQNIEAMIELKKDLGRDKDLKDLKLIDNYLGQYSPLVLAYLGDAIYEVYIRNYLINQGICKVNDLQKASVNYVSAKAQSNWLEQMLKAQFLTDEELWIIKRARNHKSHGSPKNTDIVTYKRATGFEALIGYLQLTGNNKRIKEIIDYIVGG